MIFNLIIGALEKAEIQPEMKNLSKRCEQDWNLIYMVLNPDQCVDGSIQTTMDFMIIALLESMI